ncbi:hypothetical protein BDZ97DRAFT_1915704 [Flammula alnicola]|nr:hypothetical protein BDZ97DRAFT_1915704 [Flammula alnicola]
MSPSPWPEPTPPPVVSRRKHRRRQIIADQSEVTQAETDCEINSGNNVFSCFPTSSTTIPQHEWASFVWNSRRPELTQTNLVDIFLFRADSQQQILHLANQTNPSDQAGHITQQVDDRWFGTQGFNFNGTQTPFPFYWVIIRSDKTLDGNQVPQPIFTAVQTTVLDSVAAASSSSALAAASSSSAIAASLSSLSAASASSHAHTPGTPTSTSNPGNVQHASSASPFPHWAIAVIVVLGFLAIAATCILAFLILRRIRRRREQTSSRTSMGSASPMILNQEQQDMSQRYDTAGSPLLPPPSTLLGAAAVGAAAGGAAASGTTHDGASTISDSGGPFSGADAAIMADAFRKMLRKPDFADRPVEEGDSPDGPPDDEGMSAEGGNVVLSRQLAEEGRDIRSVSSSRGVKVETHHPDTDP